MDTMDALIKALDAYLEAEMPKIEAQLKATEPLINAELEKYMQQTTIEELIAKVDELKKRMDERDAQEAEQAEMKAKKWADLSDEEKLRRAREYMYRHNVSMNKAMEILEGE